MQTRLSETLLASPAGAEADRILRSCVHCGFCNATCPTYQLRGDELDGPRGRIYLIKQMLEGADAGEATRLHLDRCLTCRSCETTCPSGVEYSHLLEIGREHIERSGTRPRGERLLRRLLRFVLPEPGRVRWALRAAPYVHRLLPAPLAAALPRRKTPPRRAMDWPEPRHARRVLVLEGCVQSATHPHINSAAARLLDRRGISLIRARDAACCGAVSLHLAAPDEARAYMLRNVLAWWPHVEQGAEAIVSTSSACSSMLKDYGRLLGDDPVHGEKARRIAALATDVTGLVTRLAPRPAHGGGTRRIAFHAPCSLQHGLRGHTAVETLLRDYGFELTAVRDAHLCCGAAGTYAVLQPELSRRLRDDKLAALEAGAPEAIATANIGCLIHFEQATQVPVRHWLELIEEADDRARNE